MAFKEIPKKYVAEVEEAKVLEFWKEKEVFKFVHEPEKEMYSIDTPPPTVSGNMHIGHSFSYSQEDFIARYKRLAGFNVFYPFGSDDNGLPTERLVEKKKKVSIGKMERGDFRDLCYNTVEEIKADFISDWIRLGISCDYTKSYSTISKEVQRLSQKAFIDLYNKGRVYEQEAPMSWCVKCQTAIAQAEFESKDITSHFNDIIFKSSEGDDLLIATTRPEFLPACVALFAHPDDERYTHLKGKTATVPLFNYEVPILFDENVELDKGTGLMMVCTFGDKEDIDKWNRYKLPLRIIFTEYGVMNDLAGAYEGLKIAQARETIINDLKNQELLIGQKDITHAVNVHERCGTELEFLKTKQWFIKILDQKEKLLEKVEEINWYPSFMKTRMVHWIENLNWDWCISRQRYYGIPFPVWRHKETGEIILANEDQLPVDPSTDIPGDHKKEDLIPEMDVMDTWATSSISPQIALDAYGIPADKMPMNLRPQAHDIIRTWAFYTLVRSVFEKDIVPWKDIVISGFVMAAKGEKMSKSKGNVVDPRQVIGKYSADIMRFWAAGSKLGEDLPYNEQDLQAGQRFVTKIWNSFKFLAYFLENEEFDPNDKPELTVQDKWMLTELDKLVESNKKDFDKYEYDKVKYKTEQFFWQTFCDNYIEIVKDRLYKPEIYGEAAKKSGLYTFYHSLKSICIMMNALTPFVTESLWQYFFTKYEEVESIANSSWPTAFGVEISEEESFAGDLAVNVTSTLRKYKSENNKPLNSEISLKVKCDSKIKEQILMVEKDILGTAKADKIEFVDETRGDITMGEPSDEETVEANEKKVPESVAIFTIDVEFKDA